MPTYVDLKTSLTGGGANALDGIDGDSLSDGDAAIVLHGGRSYLYILDADSGAGESSPDVVAPDSNPGDKRWVLQGPHVPDASTSTAGLVQLASPAEARQSLDPDKALAATAFADHLGGAVQMGQLIIRNNAGTLQHIFANTYGSGSAAMVNRIDSPATSWTDTPTGDNTTTPFAGGGKVDSLSSEFILNCSSEQDFNKNFGFLTCFSNSSSLDHSRMYARVLSRNVNGQERNRFHLCLGGNINDTSIASGQAIGVMLFLLMA